MSAASAQKLEKIVSGGQTGADRAALDVAIGLGLETGGWVPHGRRAEDGRIPARYAGLIETATEEYGSRTALNVRDADATLIFSFGEPIGATALTLKLARSSRKPYLAVDLERSSSNDTTDRIRDWLTETGVRVLNVAGPRASGEPRIAAAVTDVLSAAVSGDES